MAQRGLALLTGSGDTMSSEIMILLKDGNSRTCAIVWPRSKPQEPKGISFHFCVVM